MTPEIEYDLIDLSQLRLDLDGVEAKQAAQFLHVLFFAVAEKLNCDTPDFYGPNELEGAGPGYSVCWVGPWDIWATNLVAYDGSILLGWRSLRSPLVYTERSVATAPHVRLRSGNTAVVKFTASSYTHYGITFTPCK